MRAFCSFTTSVLVLCVLAPARGQLIDFEDVLLDPDTAWVGPTDNSVEEPDAFGGTVSVGTFESRGATFLNKANAFGLAQGFAVSSRQDTTTPGFTSGTTAITGTGVGDGNDNYATVFGYLDELDPMDIEQLEALPWFDVPEGTLAEGAWVTNTTYSALSMRDGDSFAKKFGGETGDDPDFFQLNIYGSSNGDALAEHVEFLLADFRSDNVADDFILDEWRFVDLAPLAHADRIYFDLDSSDVGTFGMNTPGYFAIDNIRVAEILPGDIDRNGTLNVQDADQLCQLVRGSGQGGDTNDDGVSNAEDMQFWLELAGFSSGDADLNGVVNVRDFLTLSDHFGSTDATWSQGDFDCNGTVEVGDFLALSRHFGDSREMMISAVPEPHTLAVVWALLMGIAGLRRTLKSRSCRCSRT